MENQASDRIIFFDSREVVVIGVLLDTLNNTDNLVIEFSSRNNSGRPVRKLAELFESTSEKFFRKRNIPAIYIFARTNEWWQTPSIFKAIEALQAYGLREKYRHICTYGLSMGGYGALMFSRKLQADRVVAIAPQYSIDSQVVPFETRWQDDRSRVQFMYDDMAEGLIQQGQVVVFYDKFFEFDHLHVEMIEKHRPVDKFLVNFSTHTVARSLNDMGILSRVMERVLTNRMSRREFVDVIRRARKNSPLTLHNMADALKKSGHQHYATGVYALAIDVMEQRIQQKPDYYMRKELAFASIRVIEGYLRNITQQGVLTRQAYQRCYRMVERFDLIPNYIGWAVIQAKSEFTLGNIEAARLLVRSAVPNVRDTEATKFLRFYVQILSEQPVLEDLEILMQHFHKHILANDVTAVKFGALLLRANQPVKAQRYLDFYQRNFKRWYDKPDLMRQQLLALVQCNPARAQSLLEAAFANDQLNKEYLSLKQELAAFS